MLVITSDLHLTDGTSGTTIKADAAAIFRYRLTNLAYAASCRMYGTDNQTYEPIKEIDVVLLGDIFDVIRSTKWLQDRVRPWDGPDHPELPSKVKEITQAIIENNQCLLQVFRGLSQEGVEIPAEHAGAPDEFAKQKVDVRFYYVVGNHDWFYHVPGAQYDAIRASVIDALALHNDGGVFPWDTDESDRIKAVCRAHHVFARHGDKFDSSNCDEPDRDQSSLGDAVVIELVDRFAELVKQRLDGRAPKELCEIDNIRPLELVPTFIDGLLRKCDHDTAHEVRTTWNEVVDDFLSIPFVRQHHSSLKWGLRITQGLSFASLGRLVPWAKNVLTSFATVSSWLNTLLCRFGASSDMYLCALREPAFAENEISYIVYGHSHRHEIVPLRNAMGIPGKPKSAYLNAGTWRAVFDLARFQPGKAEFFGYHVMTYLSFFNDEERREREFETWSGSFESPFMRQPMPTWQPKPAGWPAGTKLQGVESIDQARR